MKKKKKNWLKKLKTYTNADMKILQYVRLHIKNGKKSVLHYNTIYFLRYEYLKCAQCLFLKLQMQHLWVNNSRIPRIKKVNFRCITFI